MITTIQKERERLIESVKTNKKVYVICPSCGRGGMEYGYNETPRWVCLWRDCQFTTRNIPSVQEIKELINLKTQLKQITDWKI